MPEDDPPQDLTPSDQPTGDLSDSEKLDLILVRLSALERKVEERLKDTRPIWESVQAQLRQINNKLDVLNKHLRSSSAAGCA